MDKKKNIEVENSENVGFREAEGDTYRISQQAIHRISGSLKNRNYVLAVSHANYLVALGGTEKVLHEEQAALKKRNISYIQVYPCDMYDKCKEKRHFDQLVGVNVDSVQIGNFSITQLGLILQLLDLWQLANAVAIHIHHLMDLSILGIKCLIDNVHASKLRFFLHDYYTICPQFNLLKDDRIYCGAPHVESEACKECIWGPKRSLHFRMFKTLFKSVKPDFIIPSHKAATIWIRSFPEHADKLRVIPHQIARKTGGNVEKRLESINNPAYRPKIAYVGYEGVNKGCLAWWNITSQEAVLKGYDLFHLGAASVNIPGVKKIAVSFLEDGPDAMVKALRKYEIDIAFLWSIWPETYSFTLYEAFASGCFVITNGLSGNIAEQIRDSNRGIVFNDESEMLEFLSDVSKVKEAIILNLRENPSCELEFNLQLAAESAEGLNIKEGESVDKKVNDLFNGNIESWYYLLRKLELESIRSENLIDIEEIYLNYDRSENIHRVIEHLRRKIDKYPLLRFIVKKAGSFVWMIFCLLRRKVKKF